MEIDNQMTEIIKIGFKNSKKSVPLAGNAITRLIEEKGDKLILKFYLFKLYLFANPKVLNYIFSNPNKYIRSHKSLGNSTMLFGKNGIGTMQDLKKWKKDREILDVLFNTEHMPNYISTMAKYISAKLEAWQTQFAKQKSINLFMPIAELTMGSIIDLLYKGVDIDVTKFVTLEAEIQELSSAEVFFGRVKFLGIIPMPLYFKFKKAQNELVEMVKDIVKQSFTNAPPDNIIRYISKEWGYPEYQQMNAAMKYHIQCEATTFVAATYVGVPELVMTALALFSYNPILKSRCDEEIQSIIGLREPTYEDLKKLTFTRATLKEIFRVYPPVSFIVREAQENDVIEGVAIKKGSLIIIPICATHKLSTVWENPESFDPERFLKPMTETQKELYMPYGRGERSCIAANLTMFQALLMIILICRRYNITLAPGYTLTGDTDIDRKMKMQITNKNDMLI